MNQTNNAREQLKQRWYDEGYWGNQTLRDFIEANAGKNLNAYLVTESQSRSSRVTYNEAYGQSVVVARALAATGVKEGDRIAIQLPNWTESLVISQACLLLGAVIIPVTAILGEQELQYIVENAGASVVFIPGQWRSRDYRSVVPALAAMPGVNTIVALDDSAPAGAVDWATFLEAGRQSDSPLPQTSTGADDLALLIYTSGTTGRPKGVQHTHNTLISEAHGSPAFLGDKIKSTILNPWPYGHIACFIPYIRFWIEGVNVVMTDRWEPDFVAEIVNKHKVGTTAGVPYFLSSLVESADRLGIDISSLENYGTGATNVPADLIRLCQDRGMFCYRMYGSTEQPTVTSGYVGDPQEKCVSTDGRPLPGCAVRIIDDEENVLPTGSDGEVAVIGPEQFVGYLDPEHNRNAFTADGWFKTGDIGRLDEEGFLTITDRKKDIIIRGGENISSREVEECLLSYPGVQAAAAIAYPDARFGEKVCVYLELTPEAEITLEDIRAHFAAAGIARQKVPEYLRTIEELPRTATGKINKQQLRGILNAELASASEAG